MTLGENILSTQSEPTQITDTQAAGADDLDLHADLTTHPPHSYSLTDTQTAIQSFSPTLLFQTSLTHNAQTSPVLKSHSRNLRPRTSQPPLFTLRHYNTLTMKSSPLNSKPNTRDRFTSSLSHTTSLHLPAQPLQRLALRTSLSTMAQHLLHRRLHPHHIISLAQHAHLPHFLPRSSPPPLPGPLRPHRLPSPPLHTSPLTLTISSSTLPK